MRKTFIAIAALVLTWIGISPGVFGQRGMGDTTGVAQQANKPEIVQLSGTVRELKTEPCKSTTGRSASGTHVILETSSGRKVEVHLGPELEVRDVAKKLAVNRKIAVAAFRTEKMAENAYVAQTVTVDDQPTKLRGENLRPVWAGGGPRPSADWGRRNGNGKGRWSAGQAATGGPGRCAAWGRGQGRGAAMGCGRGSGQGRAAGRGNGRGRGPAMRGQGKGQCRVCGAACGRGNGQGWGRGAAATGSGGQRRGPAMGRGRGQGPGQGRGRGARWGRASNEQVDTNDARDS